MARLKLLVRSRRFDKFSPVFGERGHSRSFLYTYYRGNTQGHESSTQISLPREDAVARELLRKSGLTFETIDLARSVGPRLSARIRGIKDTPTLIVENDSRKRYEGVKAITGFLAETKNKQQSTIDSRTSVDSTSGAHDFVR